MANLTIKNCTLHIYLDESGTAGATDTEYYIVGGVITRGDNGIATAVENWQKWRANFKQLAKKSSAWSDQQIEGFVIDYLLKNPIVPVATFVKQSPDLSEMINKKILSLPEARQRFGIRVDDNPIINQREFVHAHLFQYPLMSVFSSVILTMQPVKEITIVADRLRLSGFANEILKNDVSFWNREKFLLHVEQSLVRHSIPNRQRYFAEYNYACQIKKPPNLQFLESHSLLDAADAYCTLIRKYLMEDEVALRCVEKLKNRYRDFFDNRPGGYLCHDSTNMLVESARREWGRQD